MKGVTCFVDIAPVYPLRLAVGGWGRGEYKFIMKSKPFDPSSSKHGPRSPTVVRVEASSSTTATDTAGEIRVCVNRTCRRQGSMETLKTLSGIAPPYVSIESCGCLGRCGAGPNLMVLPQAIIVTHCGTPARAAHLMSNLCGGNSDSWTNSLAALALRKRAEGLLGNGNNKNNASDAELLLSEAINLKPCGGIHVLYKDRSTVRLVMGKMAESLEDAKEALTLAPKYPQAYICQGDALMAMDQFDAAEKSYAMAVELDSSIRRSKSFKARISKLQDKLIALDLP